MHCSPAQIHTTYLKRSSPVLKDQRLLATSIQQIFVDYLSLTKFPKNVDVTLTDQAHSYRQQLPKNSRLALHIQEHVFCISQYVR